MDADAYRAALEREVERQRGLLRQADARLVELRAQLGLELAEDTLRSDLLRLLAGYVATLAKVPYQPDPTEGDLLATARTHATIEQQLAETAKMIAAVRQQSTLSPDSTHRRAALTGAVVAETQRLQRAVAALPATAPSRLQEQIAEEGRRERRLMRHLKAALASWLASRDGDLQLLETLLNNMTTGAQLHLPAAELVSNPLLRMLVTHDVVLTDVQGDTMAVRLRQYGLDYK